MILDIFLAALKLLKNPPTDRVVVVGDTPWDAQGKKTGCFSYCYY